MDTKKPTRILLISPYFYPHIGGSQRYMEELYVHLMRQQKNVRVDVLAYDTDGAPSYEEYRNLRIYRIPCREVLPEQFALPNPYALTKMLWKLRINTYTHVHTHLRFFDATWWAWIYARWIGAISIFTEHIGVRPVHANRLAQTTAVLAERTLAAMAVPRFDLICATNTPAKQYMQKTYTLTKPVRIVYGGVDTETYIPLPKRNRVLPTSGTKIPDNALLISFAGRLIPAKGAHMAISAVIPIIRKYPHRMFMAIAGSGPEAHAIQTQIQQSGLTDNIFFLGPFSTAKVRQLLGQTDIFIHPSYHAEGFPNVILEAGASGCAVIATDIAGVNEIVTDTQTGLLVKPKDTKGLHRALLLLTKDREKRKAYGKSLRKHVVRHFDWNSISKGFAYVLAKEITAKNAATHVQTRATHRQTSASTK